MGYENKMLHLQITAPESSAKFILSHLLNNDHVANLLHKPGVALKPSGDVIECQIARVAADPLIVWLREHRLAANWTVVVENRDAWYAQGDPGCLEDSPDQMIWASVTQTAADSARSSWTFYVFLCLAVALAAIAVKLDSVIVVIAAMVVSPDFSPIAGACLGIVRKGYRYLIWQGMQLLFSGFCVAVLVVALVGVLGAHFGWISIDDMLKPRPQTDFIWTPDRWSFVVAVIAGCAGILAMTSSYSNALIGVFIAVTTVPAAGNLAFALAVGGELFLRTGSFTIMASGSGDTLLSEIIGSLLQLAFNLAGMLVAGVLTLLVAHGVEQRTTRKLQEGANTGSQ
jgi:uncharacterized hydrophobic protein (TIGR00271 family)